MKRKTKDYGLQETYPESHARTAPNFAITEDDLQGFTPVYFRTVFSPEDEEKMKNMTDMERLLYKKRLFDEGKYRRVPYD